MIFLESLGILLLKSKYIYICDPIIQSRNNFRKRKFDHITYIKYKMVTMSTTVNKNNHNQKMVEQF